MVQGVSQLVDEFYQAEDHKCGDQEIDDRCDKITVHQHRCGVTYKLEKSVPPKIARTGVRMS